MNASHQTGGGCQRLRKTNQKCSKVVQPGNCWLMSQGLKLDACPERQHGNLQGYGLSTDLMATPSACLLPFPLLPRSWLGAILGSLIRPDPCAQPPSTTLSPTTSQQLLHKTAIRYIGCRITQCRGTRDVDLGVPDFLDCQPERYAKHPPGERCCYFWLSSSITVCKADASPGYASLCRRSSTRHKRTSCVRRPEPASVRGRRVYVVWDGQHHETSQMPWIHHISPLFTRQLT
ncbi:hypothetical protein LY78DRAFT_5961 [Colletotrichum sublineola]|nr:hypothetical protein LY78DRAFT_5961 [Colletotrichum sublineola]